MMHASFQTGCHDSIRLDVKEESLSSTMMPRLIFQW